jgi:hypothetical protein
MPVECTSAPTTSTFLYAPTRTHASATLRPYRKPEHWLRTSSAGTPCRPSFSARKQPEPGKNTSGLRVAKTIMSTSATVRPARSRAIFAAGTARSLAPMPSCSMKRRSLMPVRWRIHSSLVGMSFARSSFVTTFVGT